MFGSRSGREYSTPPNAGRRWERGRSLGSAQPTPRRTFASPCAATAPGTPKTADRATAPTCSERSDDAAGGWVVLVHHPPPGSAQRRTGRARLHIGRTVRVPGRGRSVWTADRPRSVHRLKSPPRLSVRRLQGHRSSRGGYDTIAWAPLGRNRATWPCSAARLRALSWCDASVDLRADRCAHRRLSARWQPTRAAKFTAKANAFLAAGDENQRRPSHERAGRRSSPPANHHHAHRRCGAVRGDRSSADEPPRPRARS
jgi:hypothetical protein